jgi:DNA-binding CsgD family transcriptional regulator/tetratricopeptide (TPR) repeat protein
VELIGRAAEIAHVVETSRKQHWITITGPGGVGKTVLAEAVLRVFSDTGFAVFTVLCADLISSTQVSERLAAMLSGTVFTEELTSIPPEVREARMVILFDNLEQVTDPDVLVETVIVWLPNTRFLSTSRLRLGHALEIIVPLQPLDIAPRGPAAELLLQPLLQRVPDLKLGDEDHLRIARICERLDGLPLALRLVSARLVHVPISNLLSLLDASRLERFQDDSLENERHHSLEAVVHWSLEQLSEQQRRYLMLLALAQGGRSFEFCQAVGKTVDLGNVGDLIKPIELGLLWQRDGSVYVYETVRFVVLRNLDAQERSSLRATLCMTAQAYLQRLHDHHAGERYGSDPEYGVRVQRDLPEFLAAIAQWIDEGDAERAETMLRHLARHLTAIERSIWGLRLSARLVNLELEPSRSLSVWAVHLALKSRVSPLVEVANDYLDYAKRLEALSTISTPLQRFNAWFNVCNLLHQLDRGQEIEIYLPRLRASLSEDPSIGYESAFVTFEADVLKAKGQYSEALERFDLAFKLAGSEHRTMNQLALIGTMAYLALEQDNLRVANQYFRTWVAMSSQSKIFFAISFAYFLIKFCIATSRYTLATRALGVLERETASSGRALTTLGDRKDSGRNLDVLRQKLRSELGERDFEEQLDRGRHETIEDLCQESLTSTNHPQILTSTLTLTNGEQRLIDFLNLGYTNKRIAQAMHLSPLTVRNRLSDLYAKLNVQTRQAAVQRIVEIQGTTQAD